MGGKAAVLAGLLLFAGWAGADELVLRPSLSLIFKEPELMRPGACVRYGEGGSAWMSAESAFWLKGRVVASAIRLRKVERCPESPGRGLEQFSREEYDRRAAAYPCAALDGMEREEQFGLVRIRVEEWETPWARRAANSGRLYQGHFIGRPLLQGDEIEIDADLLAACRS